LALPFRDDEGRPTKLKMPQTIANAAPGAALLRPYKSFVHSRSSWYSLL
jgi:hypothetical protein